MANEKQEHPFTDEQVARHCAIVKDMMELHSKQEKLLRQFVLAIGLRGRSYTYDEGEVRRYELLKAAGMKPDALSWSASKIVRRKERMKELKELANE